MVPGGGENNYNNLTKSLFESDETSKKLTGEIKIELASFCFGLIINISITVLSWLKRDISFIVELLIPQVACLSLIQGLY